MSFLNRIRYVRVSDLKLGANPQGCYTDWEELAFTDKDSPMWSWLEKYVATIAYDPYKDETCPKYGYMKNQDVCDLVFYNVAHVMCAWTDCDVTVTEEMVHLAVETANHMLTDVVMADWVCRCETVWSEKYLEHRRVDLKGQPVNR